MHFCFISTMHGHPWGGSEELWSQAATRLLAEGHQVSASVHHWPKMAPELRVLRERGCRIHQRRERIGSHFLYRLVGDTPEMAGARAFLKSTAPDVVFISCGAFADELWWYRACRQLGVRYMILANAVSETSWPRDERVRQIHDAYTGAAKVYFVSQGNQRLVETMIGTRLSHAAIIRNPYKVDYDAAPAYPDAGEVLRLACVARLDPGAKGQDLLFHVLGQDKWRKRNLRVSLYGRGTNVAGLKALAKMLDLRSVDFCDHVSDIQEIWRTHHLLILPSRYEGLPLALIEAMLCGRGSIVTDVAGHAEVVHDGETGFLAEAATVRHLDHAMERAWERRGEWQSIGAEAGRRIRTLVPRDPVGVFLEQLRSNVSRQPVNA